MKIWLLGSALCLVAGCSSGYQTDDVAKAIRNGDNALVAKTLRADRLGVLDDNGHTNLLEVSVETGNLKATELLLRHGANPNGSWRSWWKIPLKSAVRNGDVAAVRLLLEYGADPTSSNALEGINRKKNGGEIAKLLLRAGADPNGPSGYDASLLSFAASNEDPWPTLTLLEAGANPNSPSQSEVTPLHLATQHRRWETVKLLVEHGANKHVRDKEGKTPLDVAGDLVGLLQRYGAKHGG